MMSSLVMAGARSKDCGSKSPIVDGDDSSLPDLNSTSDPPSFEPLCMEKPNPDMIIQPSAKGVLQKSAFNPHARVVQNYNIVEELAMSPSTIADLAMLQTCQAQRKLILLSIGAIDPQDSNLIIFYLENHVPQLQHKMAIHLLVFVKSRRVFRTIIDEGASTCIMYIYFWKALGSPKINQYPMSLKVFDGRGFQPYGILNDLPIELEGKTIAIEVEAVNSQLDYNILLGRIWTYDISVVVSSFFRMIFFLIKEKL